MYSVSDIKFGSKTSGKLRNGKKIIGNFKIDEENIFTVSIKNEEEMKSLYEKYAPGKSGDEREIVLSAVIIDMVRTFKFEKEAKKERKRKTFFLLNDDRVSSIEEPLSKESVEKVKSIYRENLKKVFLEDTLKDN